MYFTDFFIKRPTAAISISLILLVIGIRAYSNLPTRQFPVMNIPQITITTQFPGASPNIIQSFVTTPLEAAINGIEGIDYIEAKSQQNESTITVWLQENYDGNKVLSEVTARITAVLWRLPEGTYNPAILKNNKETPVFFYTIGSNQLSSQAVTDYLQRVIIPKLESVKGVQEVLVHAPRDFAMKIWLDPSRMANKNITANDLVTALKDNSVQIGVGRLRGPLQSYNLHSNGSLDTVEQFNNLVIKNINNHLIKIKDIGEA